jgi:Trypsin-like peptidase domain
MPYVSPAAPLACLIGISDEPPYISSLGTCFALHKGTYFLTAAHCVGTLTNERIQILPHEAAGLVLEVADIFRHPTADLALIEARPHEAAGIVPFYNIETKYTTGLDVMAFGYQHEPLGVARGDAGQRIYGSSSRPRLFKGYFQTFREHRSYMGYSYFAGELNFQCPGGVSGGPVFVPGPAFRVLGLLTENRETTSLLHTEEEVQQDGTTVITRYRTVINYGTCLMLDRVVDWLAQAMASIASGHRPSAGQT